MDILNEIVVRKKEEIAQRKKLFPLAVLQQSIFYQTKCMSMVSYIKRSDKSGIIAEFKRKSPSQSAINLYAKVEDVTIGYMQAGASGLSILTDEHFFGGKNEDLRIARKFNFCPILRKDFIIDIYQIHEAKSIGADAILLIAEILNKEQVVEFAQLAKSMSLEVIIEVHSADQLGKLNDYIDIIGVNNRNLVDFTVDINTSIEMIKHIPSDKIKISESGISNIENILTLKKAGYDGFLIGQHFMETANPSKKCRQFIKELTTTHQENIIVNP